MSPHPNPFAFESCLFDAYEFAPLKYLIKTDRFKMLKTMGEVVIYRPTTIAAMPQKSVLTNLSSKCDRFLAARSESDTDHGVDFYAPIGVTYPRPLCVRFLRLSFAFYDTKS